MYYIHYSFSVQKELFYLHLFEYDKTTSKSGGTLAVVKNSLFRLGVAKGTFQRPGETLFIHESMPKGENVNDLAKTILYCIFENNIQAGVSVR